MLPLVETLTAAFQPPLVCPFSDGTTVVFLPHGGRVLGLFTGSSDENFLWTNLALESRETARALFASEEWHNSGGDRTWLAPEVDVFLPDYPRTDRYWQPRNLDPGEYKIWREGRGTTFGALVKLVLSRTKEEASVRITKTVSPAANPLRHEQAGETAGVSYAGYTLVTGLTRLDSSGLSPIGIWNLLQMPHGGTMIIPTHTRAIPRTYFGEIAACDLVINDHVVYYRMRSAGEHKIGLRAVTVPGRVGYLYPAQGGNWSLVIRNFFVVPSGEYVDVPWDDPTDFGYAVQACSVNSTLGQFSELEYHAPVDVPGSARRGHWGDVSQVWAFRGSWNQIAAVAARLLTSEPLPSLS